MLKGKGVLTPIQEAVLAAFAELPDQDQFYLAGGTALAEFYLGHRISFDLDFFTREEALILPLSYQLETIGLSQGFEVSVTRRFAAFVAMLLTKGNEQVRLELALDSPFRFESPSLSERGVWVNSFQDLKADKMLAYFGRAEPRDAIDIYFIMQQEPVDVLLELAAEKDPGFDLYWFAVALNRAQAFPDEPERWPVKTLVPFDPLAIKQTFRDLAIDLMARVTSEDTEG